MKTPISRFALLIALLAIPGCAAQDASSGSPGPDTSEAAVVDCSSPELSVADFKRFCVEDAGRLESLPIVVEPANPVTILAKISGCIPIEGTNVGEDDFNGNRYASCKFMDNIATDADGNPEPGTAGTSVDVRTYPGDPRELETNPQFLKSDDGTRVILGEDFKVTITGIWSAYSAHLGLAEIEEIARQVGGEFVPPA